MGINVCEYLHKKLLLEVQNKARSKMRTLEPKTWNPEIQDPRTQEPRTKDPRLRAPKPWTQLSSGNFCQ